MRHLSTMFATAMATILISSPSSANNLVQNGSLENSTFANPYNGVNPINGNTPGSVTGWKFFGSTPGNYNVMYFNNANPYFMPASFTSGSTKLPGTALVDPDGGYLVNLDGDPAFNSGIEQTLTGLVVGQKYAVKFSWAAVQRSVETGPTTENLLVGFGSQFLSTPTLNTPSHGFSGWFTDRYVFKAAQSSEVLSFLARGTPHGLPPSVNLDGISVTAVPEPVSWVMMLTGFGFVGAVMRRRVRSPIATA